MSISSATSIAVATRQWKYDIFLNFRGGDIRRTFLSHLREALCRAKLVTFFDENLMRGEEISPALLMGIEESNVAVAIFSKDYASSPWCLGELMKIIECYEHKGQIVIPVFYDVSSSIVLEQSGIYAEAFAKHKRDRKNARYVPQWKAAMTKAANLSGRSARNTRSDSELVKAIVNDILMRLGRTSDGIDGTAETGSGVQKTLFLKVSHTRTVELHGPDGLRMAQSEELPAVDHLVSLLEPLQHLSEAPLQSLENSNADSSHRHESALRLLGYGQESENAGQKSGTVVNSKAETVQASAPSLLRCTEGSKIAGSGSSTQISSSPTNSEFFLPGAVDRIVLYVTSSELIGKTFEDCDAVRRILRGFGAFVDERDTLDSTHRKELESALKGKTISLPIVFIKGKYIGGVVEIKKLKETGQLANLVEGVSVDGDGKIASNNEPQAPKWRSLRLLEHSGESKIVAPVGSSEVASSSEPQAATRHPWRRVEHSNEESKNVIPVDSSEVDFLLEPRAPIWRRWRRIEHNNEESKNAVPVDLSDVASSSESQIPKVRQRRRPVAYNEESKNVAPVGSGAIASLSNENSFFLSGSEDKIVLFFTSMEANRKAYEDCREVRTIFRSLRVAVDERNTYIDPSHMGQLRSVLRGETFSLPEVFIRGKYIGGVQAIRQLNEAGKLKQLVQGFPVRNRAAFCETCGDTTYVLCPKCRPGGTCRGCRDIGMIPCSDCCSA